MIFISRVISITIQKNTLCTSKIIWGGAAVTSKTPINLTNTVKLKIQVNSAFSKVKTTDISLIKSFQCVISSVNCNFNLCS